VSWASLAVPPMTCRSRSSSPRPDERSVERQSRDHFPLAHRNRRSRGIPRGRCRAALTSTKYCRSLPASRPALPDNSHADIRNLVTLSEDSIAPIARSRAVRRAHLLPKKRAVQLHLLRFTPAGGGHDHRHMDFSTVTGRATARPVLRVLGRRDRQREELRRMARNPEREHVGAATTVGNDGHWVCRVFG
jgi:hypothetical protein